MDQTCIWSLPFWEHLGLACFCCVWINFIEFTFSRCPNFCSGRLTCSALCYCCLHLCLFFALESLVEAHEECLLAASDLSGSFSPLEHLLFMFYRQDFMPTCWLSSLEMGLLFLSFLYSMLFIYFLIFPFWFRFQPSPFTFQGNHCKNWLFFQE